jgi:hypothetical protein
VLLSSAGNKPKAGAMKTSGKFRLPISFRRGGGDENVVGKTGTGVGLGTKRRVITYLPPPVVMGTASSRSALASASRGSLGPGSGWTGSEGPGDVGRGVMGDVEDPCVAGGGGKRKRESHALSSLPTPGGHGDDDDHTSLGSQQKLDRYHAFGTVRQHRLPSPPTSDPPMRPYAERESEKEDDVVLEVDVHEMRKRYPRTRLMMTEVRLGFFVFVVLFSLPPTLLTTTARSLVAQTGSCSCVGPARTP